MAEWKTLVFNEDLIAINEIYIFSPPFSQPDERRLVGLDPQVPEEVHQLLDVPVAMDWEGIVVTPNSIGSR